MNIQTIALNKLQAPTKNPRSRIDAGKLAGLAQSIFTDGLLQNLVVIPTNNKKKPFRIIAGERRYRALQLLRKKGKIKGTYQVPVEIRSALSADDVARIATVENVQREQLPPMDEAIAFKGLVHEGAAMEEIAAQTGVSTSTITRRLALNNLCEEARQALSEGDVTLAQAEALAIGKHEAQQKILPRAVNGGYGSSPEQIKEAITAGKPSKALAIFPLEQYHGTFTSDLFADDETTYFDDVAQFMLLQEAAAKVLAASYADKADWVEITQHYVLQTLGYEDAPKGERGGMLINIAPDGEVEIKEGLIKVEADEETLEEVLEEIAAPKKPKPAYSKSLCVYIANHKTLAVQAALIEDHRKAKEIAIVQLLGKKVFSSATIGKKPHKALSGFDQQTDKPAAYNALEKEALELTGLIDSKTFDKADGEQSALQVMATYHKDEMALYKAVKKLSDANLERLLVLLVTMPFGQEICDTLDTGGSLFNVVARDLKVDMGKHWTPDRAFLEKRDIPQLQTIARECGFASERSWIGNFRKGDLVTELDKFFAAAHAADKPTDAQKKALVWLDQAFHFPAVNPDEKQEEEDDTALAA